MTEKVRSALPYILGLYLISIFTSMAGMEMFGWLSAFCGLLLLPSYLKKSIDCRLKLICVLLTALFVFNVFSAIAHDYTSKDILNIIGRMRWAILLILLVPAFNFLSDEKLEKLVKIIFILGSIISVYAIFQHFTGIDFVRGNNRAVTYFADYSGGTKFYRAAGFLSSPMTFGNSFGLFVAVILGYLFSIKTFKNKPLVVVAILGAGALYATYSRGVWVAYAVCVLIALWMYLPRKQAFISTAVAALPLILNFIFSATFRIRFLGIFDASSISVRDRLRLWAANLEMFKEFPLLGVGYGKNEDLALEYLGRLGIDTHFAGHAHNTFLQFLSGTGLIGTLIYLALSVLFLIENYKLIQANQNNLKLKALFSGLLMAQVFLHLGGLTECNFKDAEVNHFAMAIFGLILSRRIVTSNKV